MSEEEKKKTIAEREEGVLALWERKDIFRTSVEKNKKGKPFVFYEGPPTANGLPGLHHVEGRAFKDIIPRYKTMRGFYVARKAGWDTHGLPVEIQVEKKLGFKNKQDIENFGIAEFNAEAKKSVWEYKEQWERLTKRMGFWIDLKNPYITYETAYIESLWWIIKEFWKKGYLEQDYKVMPWCTRCATGLSSHELAQGYKKTADRSVYVKFKLEPNQKIDNFTTDDKTYILAWTTTPWTLPGNVGLAIGKEIEYQIIKIEEEFILASKDVQSHLPWDTENVRFLNERINNQNLMGLVYKPLFDVPELKKHDTAYRIYAADFVSAEEGTGVVHTAVMYGEDDYKLGKKVGLPTFHTVDENGKFISTLKDGLAGLYVKSKETEDKIIQLLKDKNLLFAEEQYTHDYPFCWRCGTPLLYYARHGWWVRTTAVKKDLLANNEKINWVPEHLKKGRFGEFLKDVRDWAFSRERYWGTPLPIWKCNTCTHTEVIGSCDELKKRAGTLPRDEKGETNLHRPYVDDITFACVAKQCGGAMRRVPEVADVWFDSGAMPFAQAHYPFEKDKKLSFPADYISEGVDQTSGWFYTLLVIATFLGKGNPYRNVVSVGILLDKNGQKMSKSKGNVVDPWEVIPKYGVDALRWYMYTINQPGDEKRFDERDLMNKYRGFIQTFWNSFVLFDTYVERVKIALPPEKTLTILDRWVLARVNLLIAEVTDALERYDITTAGRAIEEFVVTDFSQWYLRRSRRRFQHPTSKKEFDTAASVTAHVLLRLATLSAPFVPFLSESVYQGLEKKGKMKEGSVHLLSWPLAKKTGKQEKYLMENMARVRTSVSDVLKLRTEAGLKLRQPIASAPMKKDFGKDLEQVFLEEVNAKKVGAFDATITPELKEEGMAREIIRAIQDMRREAGLTPKDVIRCTVSGDAHLLAVVEKWESFIKKETKSKEMKIGDMTKPKVIRDIAFDGSILTVSIG